MSVDSLLVRDKVALLAEGVDRNISTIMQIWYTCPSPSSRRAWIEIDVDKYHYEINIVALLAEGVDRNNVVLKYLRTSPMGRPPRGGRG